MRVLEARYRWQQLRALASCGRPLEALVVPGAVFVDNDETTNRVRIGVENLERYWPGPGCGDAGSAFPTRR